MKKLTQAAFRRATSFIETQGRSLEQQLLPYHFGSGSKEAVLAALAAYQNEDGGFGQGLEPDVRTPASSAVATQQAFQILRTIGASSEEQVVRRAVEYLLKSYDAGRGVWPIVPPEVEDAPHAPWWTYVDTDKNFGGFLANPRAALVGFLNDYAALVYPDFLAQVTTVTLTCLETAPDKMEMHDLLCYVTLAETEHLPQIQKERLQAKLRQVTPHSVEMNPDNWGGYGLLPLGVISTPDHFLAATIPNEAIQANLDLLIDSQQPDGAWAPSWNWAFVNEAAWQAAELGWKSQITLTNLKLLHAFGRIEEA